MALLWGGAKLHVLTVSRRWRWGWGWRLPAVPLRRGLAVGLREGVGGASADAKGSEAAQAAGRPRERDLGPGGRSHRGAVQLGLRQPGRDLHLSVGVQVWHEGGVDDSSSSSVGGHGERTAGSFISRGAVRL